MKKLFFVFLILTVSISADAQLNFGKLGNLVKDVTSTIGMGNTEITSENLIGTWSYSLPAIILESDNVLSNIGGKAVTSSLQNQVSQYLQKIGIKPGSMQFVFNTDNSMHITISNKNLTGTWSINDTLLVLVMGGAKATPVKCNTKMNGEKLQIVVNADFLLKVIGVAEQVANKTASSILKLAEKYKGLKIGFEFEKKQE